MKCSGLMISHIATPSMSEIRDSSSRVSAVCWEQPSGNKEAEDLVLGQTKEVAFSALMNIYTFAIVLAVLVTWSVALLPFIWYRLRRHQRDSARRSLTIGVIALTLSLVLYFGMLAMVSILGWTPNEARKVEGPIAAVGAGLTCYAVVIAVTHKPRFHWTFLVSSLGAGVLYLFALIGSLSI
jgi:hypothetical protein